MPLNLKLTKDGDTYTCVDSDIKSPNIFCGQGQSHVEAIGSFIIANRETLDITFEIHLADKIFRSTYYGRPR